MPDNFNHLVEDLDNSKRYRPKEPKKVPMTRRAEYSKPENYIPDEGLVSAIRVALLLRKPLLLTGEPGTGKTDLASYLSWKLGHRDEKGEARGPFLFESKSASEGRDLFYRFNALGLFQAVQTGAGSKDPRDHVTFNALGEAIVRAHAPDTDVMKKLFSGSPPHKEASQSVVLIDEIDKAPRDFPNDVLNEIERMYFRIPELGNQKVAAPEGMEPIVIITSNSEKSLPPAFLRRCVYYDIVFPDNRLEEIVSARIPEFKDTSQPLVRDALSFFRLCRAETTALDKPPATGELLDWLLALLLAGADSHQPLSAQRQILDWSLSTLLKQPEDQKRSKEIVDLWLAQGAKRASA